MLKTFIEKYQIKDKIICVGVSGGSDSLALVLMANDELTTLGYKIIALTVDHGLRPSSQDEANYVAIVMKQHNIEHHILHWEGDKPVTGVEEAARNARYNLIADWCKKNNCKILMTAHHLYDQVETFFMRIERGSGLDGLCGMQDVFERDGILILRPLLYTNPQYMKKYLSDKNIKYIEDESNFCTDLLRVRIRQFLPEFEQKTGIDALKIANTMKRLKTSKSHIDKEVEKLLKNIFNNYDNMAFWCNKSEFLKLDTEMQFRLLGKIIRTISGADYIPAADKLFLLNNKLMADNFKATTLGHCYVCFLEEKLWFMPEKVSGESNNQKDWKEYVKTHKNFKNKKIPVRLKKIILSKKTLN